MNVRLYVYKIHYVFGSHIKELIVLEGKKAVKLHQKFLQVKILIDQLDTFLHNAMASTLKLILFH